MTRRPRPALWFAVALSLAACAGPPPPRSSLAPPPPPPPAAATARPMPAPALAVPAHAVPDRRLSPGDALAASREQICQPGYARAVRHVPEAVRRQVFAAYGLAGNHTGWCAGPGGCELDHLISLELGGSNAPANLWPEPYDGPWNAHVKDRLENRLHRLICAGQMPLAQAQHAIADDWIGAYRRIFGDQPVPEG